MSKQHTCICLSTTNSCSGVFLTLQQLCPGSTEPAVLSGISQVVVYTLIQLNNSAAWVLGEHGEVSGAYALLGPAVDTPLRHPSIVLAVVWNTSLSLALPGTIMVFSRHSLLQITWPKIVCYRGSLLTIISQVYVALVPEFVHFLPF